jgi:hypothetical protein
MSYGKNYRPDIRFVRMSVDIIQTSAITPRTGFSVRRRGASAGPPRGREQHPHGRTHSPPPSPVNSPPPSPPDTVCCPRGWAVSARMRTQTLKKKKKKFLFFFLVVVAGLKRERKNFGYQSPRSPRSPNSPSCSGEAARRRRFFRPSSPSHPSKLYSSLGFLNSKVPKPFSPFSLRLIDVDGF